MQKALEGMEVVDFHAHPFVTPNEDTNFYGLSPGADGFYARLCEAGITAFAGSVISRIGEPDTFEPVGILNAHAIEIKRQLGCVYAPGIHIHPKFPRESCEEITKYHKMGVRLIGELVPYMMGWGSYVVPELSSIYELAQELDMVLSLHTGSNDDELGELAAMYPKLKIVAAHPGEREKLFRHIDRMQKHDNLWLDISGTGLFRDGMLRYGVQKAGSERFLLGTDFPICNPAMQTAGVLYELSRDSDIENVLGKNAAKLLKGCF